MSTGSIRALLIEDDPMVQEINRQFVEKVDGFSVVGVAGNGVEGIGRIKELNPDLVLLDIYMPLQDGFATLEQIRNLFDLDVIVITAANDMHTVQRFKRKGAIDYIIKPFIFERFKQSLETYSALKKSLDEGRSVSQCELDELVHIINQTADEDKLQNEGILLPKGLNEVTLKRILHYLVEQSASLSAEEVAEGVGIARVTARRYLEYLVSSREVKLDIQYGGVGRPVNRYMISNK